MAIDLKLANQIWQASRWFAEREQGMGSVVRLDYYSVLMTVCALLESKNLAQALVDESWEDRD